MGCIARGCCWRELSSHGVGRARRLRARERASIFAKGGSDSPLARVRPQNGPRKRRGAEECRELLRTGKTLENRIKGHVCLRSLADERVPSHSVLTSSVILEIRKVSLIFSLVCKMSTISISTLKRMSRDTLAALLQATGTPPAKVAVIDVRDSGTFPSARAPRPDRLLTL